MVEAFFRIRPRSLALITFTSSDNLLAHFRIIPKVVLNCLGLQWIILNGIYDRLDIPLFAILSPLYLINLELVDQPAKNSSFFSFVPVPVN